MRTIFLDIDTLRPDHLGCYGYERNTSPNIDAVAADGMRFDNYYCSDAPCLPSRAALMTGRFGIHTGVVGHGGTAADMRMIGCKRMMADQYLSDGLFSTIRKAGMYTVSFSSFAERHSAYWFDAGLNEQHNVGKRGDERADEVMPHVIKWVEEHAAQDNWFVHVNLWDPHTPYRTPDSLGNPFEQDPMPKWITKEVFEEHLKHVGPHSLNELNGFESKTPPHWSEFKKYPGSATTYEEAKHLIDLYDCGIYFADQSIGRLISVLKRCGIYDDVAIIVTADHGENMGELGIYSEHGTADNATSRIPMIIKWPGMAKGIDEKLRYNIDFLPTVAELLSLPSSGIWDGKSYADSIKGEPCEGYDYLVLTQCAHVCQRSVRFDDYFYIRTYHDGMHEFPSEMLFNLRDDFYEQHNIAKENPELCAKACWYLTMWHQMQMEKSESDVDPLWTVMREGGPYHTKKCDALKYATRLSETGRADGAVRFKERHPELFT